MSSPDPKPAAPGDPDFGATAAPTRPAPPASRESYLLVAAAAFQLAILASMIFGTMLMFRTTRTVVVKVEPVDPRDMLRGEYVTLAYAFNRVPPEGVEGLPGPYTADHAEAWRGRPVYVPLVPDESGDGRYQPGPPSASPPTDGVPYLQGTLVSPSEIRFGVETFYLQAGTGATYEQAARDGTLWAVIDVTRYGWGTVTGLLTD